MLRRALVFAVVIGSLLVACQYELPLSSDAAAAAGGGGFGGAPFAVVVVPAAALSATPSVIQLRLDPPPDGLTPDRIAIASGELSATHLRELQSNTVSAALGARLVDVVAWAEPGGAIVVAPTAPLDAATVYALALSDLLVAIPFAVAATPTPVLPRVWPPSGEAASMTVGVWCGPNALPAASAPATLEPSGPSGELAVGVDGVDARCVSWVATDATAGWTSTVPLVGPPAIALKGGVEIPLDPRPFVVDKQPSRRAPPLDCGAGEVQLGDACGIVEDDEIVARSPAEPRLWTLKGGGVDAVLTTGDSDPFVIAPLPPDSDVLLAIGSFDTGGRSRATSLRVRTAPARAHVIVNEVLANPIGPEPAEEWVELLNDGAAAADLAGLVLVDLGGETPLPAVTLPPHTYALLVGDDFAADDGFDPSPPPGTLLLRVARVGKSGLSNDGEPLTLRGSDGSVLSSFPASPKPKPGLSVARTTPRAPDALPSSFVLAAPTPGAPNVIDPP